MEREPRKRIECVFLVRMWTERGPGETIWRGHVQDAATGQRFYVSAPAEVADLIARRLAAPRVEEEPS